MDPDLGEILILKSSVYKGKTSVVRTESPVVCGLSLVLNHR